MIKKKIIFLVFILLAIPLITSVDEQTSIYCGGDEQLLIGCIGDEQIFFSGEIGEELGGADTSPPVITIISPINNSHVGTKTMTLSITTDEQASCNYSLDGNSNISLGTSDTSFSKTINTPSDGNHNISYFCEDTSMNTNASIVFFTVQITGTSSGGGTTTGGAETINLDHFITKTNRWKFNSENFLYITPVNKTNETIEIDKMYVSIISNITYEEEDLKKLMDGTYIAEFLIEEQDIKKIEINITGYEGDNYVTETIKVSIKKKTIEITNTFFEKIGIPPKLAWIIISPIFLILLIILFVESYKKSKKRNI